MDLLGMKAKSEKRGGAADFLYLRKAEKWDLSLFLRGSIRLLYNYIKAARPRKARAGCTLSPKSTTLLCRGGRSSSFSNLLPDLLYLLKNFLDALFNLASQFLNVFLRRPPESRGKTLHYHLLD